MNCDDSIGSVWGNVESSSAVCANSDAGSCAGVSTSRSGNDVAVCSSRQSCWQVLAQVGAVTVEDDETVATTRECDLIASVVPPVSNTSRADGVSESNHVIDLSPPVLAHPSIATRSISVEGWRKQISIAISWRALVSVGKCETWHDARDSEGPRKQESRCHLVLLGVFVGQNVSSTTSMSTLVVAVNIW